MKMKALAMLLAICMLLGLCACGGSTASSAAPAESAASASEEAAAPEEEAPADEEEAAEPADEEEAEEPSAEDAEPVEPAVSIDYPIPGDLTFDLVTVLRMNAAEAMGDDDYSVSPAYEAMKEATGVSINFTMLAESTYSEKMNLMMASGDLPDFFSQTVAQYDQDLMSAIEQDVLIDMEPLLAENAPDYKALLDSDPDFASGVYNADGSLAQFCGRSIDRVSQGLLIRGDWLDDLGLEAPKNYDELKDVLKAFRTEKDATMALLVNFECDSGLTPFFNTSFMGFRGVNYQLTEPNGKEVICSYASEGFMNYLTYLNELFEDGIFTDDFMNTGKEYGNWESSYYGGKAGVWQDDCKYVDPAFRENGSDPNWRAEPFALSDIDVHVTQGMVVAMAGKLYITTACEYPEEAMQYVNYVYTPAGTELVSYGVEDLTYTKDADGTINYTELMTNNPDGLSFDIASVYYLPGQWLPVDQQERYLELTLAPEAVEAYQMWTAEYGDNTMLIPTGATMTAEETTEFFNLTGDVLTAVTEAASKVVVGDMSIDDYKALVATLEDGNMGQMDALYQAVYDRYLEAA